MERPDAREDVSKLTVASRRFVTCVELSLNDGGWTEEIRRVTGESRVLFDDAWVLPPCPSFWFGWWKEFKPKAYSPTSPRWMLAESETRCSLSGAIYFKCIFWLRPVKCTDSSKEQLDLTFGTRRRDTRTLETLGRFDAADTCTVGSWVLWTLAIHGTFFTDRREVYPSISYRYRLESMRRDSPARNECVVGCIDERVFVLSES